MSAFVPITCIFKVHFSSVGHVSGGGLCKSEVQLGGLLAIAAYTTHVCTMVFIL